MNWNESDYELPAMPMHDDPGDGAICLFSEWVTMGSSRSYMEYRRVVSEYRRREAEDHAEIEDLKRALDTAQRYNRLTCHPNGDLTHASARRLMDACFGGLDDEPEDDLDHAPGSSLSGGDWAGLVVVLLGLWAVVWLVLGVLP